MKILIATYSYYPYNWGGTEVYVSALVDFLRSRGHDTEVIAAVPEKAFSEHEVFYKDDAVESVRYTVRGTNVTGIRLRAVSTLQLYAKYDAQTERSFSDLFRKLRGDHWDILHLHANTAGIGESLVRGFNAVFKNVPLVTSYHLPLSCVKGTLIFGNKIKACSVTINPRICSACVMSEKMGVPIEITKPVAAVLPLIKSTSLPAAIRVKYLVKEFIASFKKLNELTSAWCVFSKEIENILLKNGVSQNKIFVSRHGADDKFFAQPRSSFSGTARQIRFGYVGRFEKIKGFLTLISAWLKLPEAEGRTLAIAGSPQTDDEAILTALEAAGTRRDIIWMGVKRQDEIAAIFKDLDCILIPSECVETGPLVFSEAVASGCCVIASDIGGCGELSGVFNKMSTTFRAGDADDLAAGIAAFRVCEQKQQPSRREAHYEDVLNIYCNAMAELRPLNR